MASVETAEQAVAKVRAHRAAIAAWPLCEAYCDAFNWATAPYIARDDRTHRLCRRFARWIQRRLDLRYWYHETESGRLAPGWLWPH